MGCCSFKIPKHDLVVGAPVASSAQGADDNVVGAPVATIVSPTDDTLDVQQLALDVQDIVSQHGADGVDHDGDALDVPESRPATSRARPLPPSS